MKGFFHLSEVQKAAPPGLIAKCGSCGLYRGCHTPKMKPYGKGDRVLVVGEAPGETEDEKGRPFIGKAGQFLRETLGRIKVDLDRDALTTNALICRPPGNKTPEPKQIDYCRPNLMTVIRKVQPEVIITLGRSALASVLEPFWRDDLGPMEKWAGWAIPLPEHWVCPTYHPSYLLRSHNSLLDRAFEAHLETAFGLEEKPPAQPNYLEQVEVLLDEKDIYQAIRKMDEEGGWVAVDYETNCLKPDYAKAQIVSCALSNGRRTISYPWWGKAITATGMFLKSKRTRKIASNVKFEERWSLQEFGRGVENWGWDTMLAAHCLDNRPGICSIKFQSFIHLGLASYNENIEPYLKNQKGSLYNRIQEIELGTLLRYGGLDALLEHKLAAFQRERMGYED